jgi:hypothetical protein
MHTTAIATLRARALWMRSGGRRAVEGRLPSAAEISAALLRSMSRSGVLRRGAVHRASRPAEARVSKAA